jgi:hypothetical protein
MISPLRLTLVALCLAVASPAVGQELAASSQMSSAQITRLVETELVSPDAREVAWGAFNAGAYQVKSAVPLLQRVLETPPVTAEHEPVALVDAVLDALIQLHAQVRASVVVPYVDLRPVQALILLTTALDRDPALLQLLTTISGNRWYCAANVLLQDKASGLAPRLLAALHLHLGVIVVDGQPNPPPGTGGVSGGGEPSVANPAGYPPHAHYAFNRSPQPGIVVLSAGPQTVYYSRDIGAYIQGTGRDVDLGGPYDADRMAYLQAMLGPSDQTVLQAQTTVSVHWSTAAALIEQVEKARADTERQYQAMLGTLVKNGRLTSDEATTRPSHIDVELVDWRNDKSIPLPIIRH